MLPGRDNTKLTRCTVATRLKSDETLHALFITKLSLTAKDFENGSKFGTVAEKIIVALFDSQWFCTTPCAAFVASQIT